MKLLLHDQKLHSTLPNVGIWHEAKSPFLSQSDCAQQAHASPVLPWVHICGQFDGVQLCRLCLHCQLLARSSCLGLGHLRTDFALELGLTEAWTYEDCCRQKAVAMAVAGALNPAVAGIERVPCFSCFHLQQPCIILYPWHTPFYCSWFLLSTTAQVWWLCCSR